jgi:predicted acetyltransferase
MPELIEPTVDLRDSFLESSREWGDEHIGCGVRPSARRRGLASWALGQVLDRARTRGMDRVMVSCDDDNVASARTIERNG